MLYRAVGKLLVLVIPVALFISASMRPVMRLNPEMPRGFVDASAHASAQERAAEERTAHAYWDSVVELIQWKYTFGSSLPDDPPDDFEIGTLAGVIPNAEEDSRVRYWHRMQKLWNSPDSWITSRQWNIHWLTDPVSHDIESIREYVRDLIKTG
jgi:hypothetical protein